MTASSLARLGVSWIVIACAAVAILLLSVVVLLVASQTVKPDFKATGHLIIVSPAPTAVSHWT